MSWLRTPTCYWFVFGLLLFAGIGFGVQAAAAVPLTSAWSGPAIAGLGFYLVLLAALFIQALVCTLRKAMAWSYRCHPEQIADLVARLDSPRYLDRVDALQTMAEACGEPFGPVNWLWCSPDQVRTLCLLYKEWWRAGREEGPALPQHEREALLRYAIARARALRDATELPLPGEREYPGTAPAVAGLPLLAPGSLVDALRPHVEETLHDVAMVINRACRDIPLTHSEYRIRGLFTQLCWDAFECGWQLRFDAADRRLRPVPALDARQPSVDWAGKYRRMIAPETTAPGSAAPAAPDGAPGEMTWGELAAALRRKVDETLDRLNEAVKDALIDGSLPGPSEDESPEPRSQVRLSPEQFVDVMRPRIEEALRRMADSLNETGGADAVGALLEALLTEALLTGLEMRANPQTADSLVPQESLH
jgi:hypothetical protein